MCRFYLFSIWDVSTQFYQANSAVCHLRPFSPDSNYPPRSEGFYLFAWRVSFPVIVSQVNPRTWHFQHRWLSVTPLQSEDDKICSKTSVTMFPHPQWSRGPIGAAFLDQSSSGGRSNTWNTDGVTQATVHMHIHTETPVHTAVFINSL